MIRQENVQSIRRVVAIRSSGHPGAGRRVIVVRSAEGLKRSRRRLVVGPVWIPGTGERLRYTTSGHRRSIRYYARTLASFVGCWTTLIVTSVGRWLRSVGRV